MITAYDYHDVTHFPRIAKASVRRHAEGKGLFFSSACLEDLASETLVRYYEKIANGAIYTDGYPIPEIAKFIVLEHSRNLDPAGPIEFDDLTINPDSKDSPSDYNSALTYVMDRFTKTERRVAEAYILADGADREKIANLAHTSPNNVSKYLEKMRSRIQDCISELVYQAADCLLREEPAYTPYNVALSLARSRQHAAELKLGITSHVIDLAWKWTRRPRRIHVFEGICKEGEPELAISLASSVLDSLRQYDDPMLFGWSHFHLFKAELLRLKTDAFSLENFDLHGNKAIERFGPESPLSWYVQVITEHFRKTGELLS